MEILKIHAAGIAKHGEIDYEALVKLAEVSHSPPLLSGNVPEFQLNILDEHSTDRETICQIHIFNSKSSASPPPLSPPPVAVPGEEGRPLPSSLPLLFYPHVFFSFPLPFWVLRVYLFLGCSSRWLGLLRLVSVSFVDAVSVVGRCAVVCGFWFFCIMGCRSTVFGSSFQCTCFIGGFAVLVRLSLLFALLWVKATHQDSARDRGSFLKFGS
jgi:hypothetical protein